MMRVVISFSFITRSFDFDAVVIGDGFYFHSLIDSVLRSFFCLLATYKHIPAYDTSNVAKLSVQCEKRKYPYIMVSTAAQFVKVNERRIEMDIIERKRKRKRKKKRKK